MKVNHSTANLLERSSYKRQGDPHLPIHGIFMILTVPFIKNFNIYYFKKIFSRTLFPVFSFFQCDFYSMSHISLWSRYFVGRSLGTKERNVVEFKFFQCAWFRHATIQRLLFFFTQGLGEEWNSKWFLFRAFKKGNISRTNWLI